MPLLFENQYYITEKIFLDFDRITVIRYKKLMYNVIRTQHVSVVKHLPLWYFLNLFYLQTTNIFDFETKGSRTKN